MHIWTCKFFSIHFKQKKHFPNKSFYFVLFANMWSGKHWFDLRINDVETIQCTYELGIRSLKGISDTEPTRETRLKYGQMKWTLKVQRKLLWSVLTMFPLSNETNEEGELNWIYSVSQTWRILKFKAQSIWKKYLIPNHLWFMLDQERVGHGYHMGKFWNFADWYQKVTREHSFHWHPPPF